MPRRWKEPDGDQQQSLWIIEIQVEGFAYMISMKPDNGRQTKKTGCPAGMDKAGSQQEILEQLVHPFAPFFGERDLIDEFWVIKRRIRGASRRKINAATPRIPITRMASGAIPADLL